MTVTSSLTITTTITLLLLLVATAQQPPLQPPEPSLPPPLPPRGCSEELVLFSPCLGYTSQPPNNVTDMATPQCCEVIASAFDLGFGDCFCYLVRQPLIFGFPLNGSRVASLPALCNVSQRLNASLDSVANQSFDSLCTGSLALPPIRSSTGPLQLPPSQSIWDQTSDISIGNHNSADLNATWPTTPQEPQDPVVLSTTAPAARTIPTAPAEPDLQQTESAQYSSAVEHITDCNSWFVLGVLTSSYLFHVV